MEEFEKIKKYLNKRLEIESSYFKSNCKLGFTYCAKEGASECLEISELIEIMNKLIENKVEE